MSASLSPMFRSLKLLESEGYIVDVVERRIPRTLITKDLFGFIDLLGIHRETGEILAVQSTSASNVSARIRKITDHANLTVVRKANWRIEVHGWKRSSKAPTWTVRREDVS